MAGASPLTGQLAAVNGVGKNPYDPSLQKYSLGYLRAYEPNSAKYIDRSGIRNPYQEFTAEGDIIFDYRPEHVAQQNAWDIANGFQPSAERLIRPELYDQPDWQNWIRYLPENSAWYAQNTYEVDPTKFTYNPRGEKETGNKTKATAADLGSGRRRRVGTQGLSLLTTSGNTGNTTGG